MLKNLAEKLKLCPLCGSEAEIKRSEIVEQVYCPNCGARNIWHPNAREHWNKRKRKTDLKPCPICGGTGKVYETYESKYCVQCRKCGFTSDATPEPRAAKSKWNRRTNDESKDN